MSHSYQVYVGNLPTSVSKEQLQNLFSQVGEVIQVWINPSFKKITYGFVEFASVISAEDACEKFNDLKLDFAQIKVRISDRTKNQLKLKKKEPSLLIELSQKIGPSRGYLLKKALVKDLRENKEIVKDFKNACVEMENITFHQEPKIIKTTAPKTNLETLETTIIRYFNKPTNNNNNWQVDIDLSNGKCLTTEQNDKFFNLQLTKPRPLKKPKPEKRFSLDYRSVCD